MYQATCKQWFLVALSLLLLLLVLFVAVVLEFLGLCWSCFPTAKQSKARQGKVKGNEGRE